MEAKFHKPLVYLSKLEPLDGSNYKRWSQKLLIFFEKLEVDYVLVTDSPTLSTTEGSSSNCSLCLGRIYY